MKSRAKPLLALAFLLAYASLQFFSAGGPRAALASGPAARTPPAAPQDFPTPPTKITAALATVPVDMKGTPEQGPADLYSWLTFIALNWPANTSTCGPNLNQTILNDRGTRVWETYLEDSDVFVKPPATPAPWCPKRPTAARAARPSALPPRVRNLARQQGVRKMLYRNSKSSELLEQRFPGVEEAVGGVLTDQNGRFVRYEVRVNQDEYRFLVKNNLWNRAGQDAYTQAIQFPVGPSPYGPTGAIEIKAAWKVLSPREIAGGRFFTTRAVVYNDDAGHPSPGANPVTLGLVGFHVMHKTAKQRRWLWSTFEHADNLTPPPGSPPGAKASFFNPDCPPATCPPNAQTAASPYTELAPNGKPLNRPVQVVRLNPTGDNQTYNDYFAKLLAGSVWANYRLISTQWVGELGTLPKPAFLANMTMETFVQAPAPPSDGPVPYPSPGYNPFNQGVASSSCMKCHSVATTASGKAKSDFSFLMGNAQ
jgi:hypothetical protein